jgi:hypothetical protein
MEPAAAGARRNQYEWLDGRAHNDTRLRGKDSDQD